MQFVVRVPQFGKRCSKSSYSKSPQFFADSNVVGANQLSLSFFQISWIRKLQILYQ